MSLDVYLTQDKPCTVFTSNITHNLTKMADEAGIYRALWRPHETGIRRADDLAHILKNGLDKLLERPEHFKQFNPENGWGDYDTLVRFVTEYIAACREFPEADVSVWR